MPSTSRLQRARRWALPALALLLACTGCEEAAPSPRAPAPPAEVPEAAEVPEVAPSPWPTEVRPLEESVADFESTERCVEAMRGSVPVEVAELFYDLGYDDALGEICRSLEAAATGDPARCDALVSSRVKRRCRTRVAALHEKPEACPEAEGASGGRDPTCLAWATRDASLCDGASSGARAPCLAVATGEAERCEDPLGLRSVAACQALVARLAGIVDADAPPDRPAPELALDESDPQLRLPADAARALERGLVATADRCAHRTLVAVRAPLGTDRAVVALTLELRFEDDGARLGSASEVAIGPVGTGYALHGEVSLDDTELRLGGPLAARFEATYLRDGVERSLSGHLRSFFRDVAPLPERCRQ